MKIRSVLLVAATMLIATNSFAEERDPFQLPKGAAAKLNAKVVSSQDLGQIAPAAGK